nr:hypothetical protein [Verrucomicrobiota bacterium JB025]
MKIPTIPLLSLCLLAGHAGAADPAGLYRDTIPEDKKLGAPENLVG